MTNNNPYNLELLWETINDGLRFFEDELGSYISGPKKMKGFTVRPDDKTGSCYISKSKDTGRYLFTDFGGNNITPNQKGVNAIDYIIATRNVDFAGACKILFNQYNLPILEKDKVKPVTDFSSKVTKKDGFWNVDFHKKIQDVAGLKRIVPFYTDELLKEYDFKQIKLYENVGTSSKGIYHRTITATDDFPIYGYDRKDFVKIYQPNAPKGDEFLQKHSFIGEKTKDIIYGWDNLLSKVDIKHIEYLEECIEDCNNARERNSFIEDLEVAKLQKCIIVTGGSDGLNIASLGYDVIWFNSETEIISSSQYRELSRYVNDIYYCPDLDKTGVDQAVKMGMKFTKIKMIWLPESLKDANRKDAADWVRMNKNLDFQLVKNLFGKIVSQALEFEFWKYNPKRGSYGLAVNQMLQFLKYNGFYQFEKTNNGADATSAVVERIFVKIENNVIQKVDAVRIKEFCLAWLRTNAISLDIQEMIIKSVFFSDKSAALMSLPFIELNTKSGTDVSQIYFFNNDAVSVQKDKIEVKRAEYTKTLTWESNIIKRDFKLQDAPFAISINDAGEYDIDIKNDASNYFKVLINTSRVFWQKDIDKQGTDLHKYNIASDKLTPEEQQLQKLQLINKIFCIGHLLHKYKMKSKSYLVLGIDRKIGESAKDNKGGSGKSFTIETVFNYIFNRSIIDGRNLTKENSNFMLDGITKETDLIYFEDLSPFYDFNSFFNYVTGEIKANHKGGKIFTIPFHDFAKPIVTMNAVPYDITDSLRRRLVVFECSDYYHEIGDEYQETRTIRSDFGKDLFDENYSSADWANDDNFMMYALQFYLNCGAKIEIEQGNLMARNLIQQIGQVTMEFLNNFFKDASNLTDKGHVDDKGSLWVYKKSVYDEFKLDAEKDAGTPTKFKTKLQMYCKLKEMEIVFEKKKIDGVGNSVEHFNVNFGDKIPVVQAATNDDDEPDTDLPF